VAKSRGTKTIKEVAVASPGDNWNMREVADFLLSNVPELAEAFTRADIELALDDRGWLSSRQQSSGGELDSATRITYLNKSRMYWLRDPLAKQAVRLWTDYSLGTGISYNASPEKLKKIDAFFKHRRNRRILSSEGQRKSSKKLLVDGEVFFAIFTQPDGSKIIRWVDPAQITHIVSNPDDCEHILGYRRVIPDAKTGGAKNKALFYADWTADEEDRAMMSRMEVENDKVVLQKDVVIYPIPFDSIHQRGNGLLTASLDWTREHRRFMEARVAITQALSKYAHKLTVKGGQNVVNKVAASLQSTFVTSQPNTPERNPKPAAGGTFVQNDGLDLQAVPKMTGAGDAATDGNQLKLMVCAGVGVMLHYMGDPSTGNLATATAMELPMLKMFESYQELWKDAYMDIIRIVLDEDNEDGVEEEADEPVVPPEGEPATVDEEQETVVELPPILADDLTALGTALNSFATQWPELAEEDEILTMVLTAMRVNNVEEVLTNLRQVRVKQKAEQAKKEEQQFALDTKKVTGDPTAQLSNKEAAELTEALNKVASILGAQ
jgi:hypothetical protein